ncbi:MAG: NFACT RNA binding domain-containing protein, partial [Candidatus Diapherotrites archaeon]
FEKAKKAKSKLKGLEFAMAQMKGKIAKSAVPSVEKKLKVRRVKEWFEKFHWQYTSGGFLVIGGRDAHSNEQVVKKYMDEKDVYFHAEIQGAPHCVLKTEGKIPNVKDLREAAEFAGIFSKAWGSGSAGVDVYSAAPSQVSKQAQSGESMGTGAFMIYGEREWYKRIPLQAGIGVDANGRVQCGSLDATKANCGKILEIVPGRESKSDATKKIRHVFVKYFQKDLELDEILSVLPNGESQVRLEKQS